MQHQPQLFTLAQFAERNPAFSVPALRWLKNGAADRRTKRGVVPANGFSGAFLKIGRRVYVVESIFLQIALTKTSNPISVKGGTSDGDAF